MKSWNINYPLDYRLNGMERESFWFAYQFNVRRCEVSFWRLNFGVFYKFLIWLKISPRKSLLIFYCVTLKTYLMTIFAAEFNYYYHLSPIRFNYVSEVIRWDFHIFFFLYKIEGKFKYSLFNKFIRIKGEHFCLTTQFILLISTFIINIYVEMWWIWWKISVFALCL